jgi:hypothetical protein
MENSQLHNIKTSLVQLSSHVTIYQKGPHYFGIMVCNRLPSQIKNQFKTALNVFQQLHSFCTLVENFNHNTNSR